MRRITVLLGATVLAVGLTSGPALAEHAHHMKNGSGCVDISVNAPGQIHEGSEDYPDRGVGRKFHGAAHVGAAVDHDPDSGYGTLGHGNSPNQVGGGACPA